MQSLPCYMLVSNNPLKHDQSFIKRYIVKKKKGFYYDFGGYSWKYVKPLNQTKPAACRA